MSYAHSIQGMLPLWISALIFTAELSVCRSHLTPLTPHTKHLLLSDSLSSLLAMWWDPHSANSAPLSKFSSLPLFFPHFHSSLCTNSETSLNYLRVIYFYCSFSINVIFQDKGKDAMTPLESRMTSMFGKGSRHYSKKMSSFTMMSLFEERRGRGRIGSL